MIKLDIKSLILGAVVSLCAIALISSTPNTAHTLEYIEQKEGALIFNHETNIMYCYKIFDGKMMPKPYVQFEIAVDGASISRKK